MFGFYLLNMCPDSETLKKKKRANSARVRTQTTLHSSVTHEVQGEAGKQCAYLGVIRGTGEC